MISKEKKEIKFKAKKPFKKKIKGNIFEKKILKKIYISRDKEYILSLYERDKEGNYILKKESFTKEEMKKIKSIADAVNKNSGGIFDFTKVGLLLVIVAGIIIFSVLFKNRLLTMALKSGLEAIFNAKAEVQGLNFELLNAKISIRHLEVANADAPMKNLFELDKTEIHLNSEQLLYGKFIAKNIECQGIRWNTDRKTSGALPGGKKPSDKKSATEEKKESKPLLDIGKIDVNKLIADNKTNIKSMALISNANLEITSLTNKWDDNLKNSKKRIDEVSKGVEEIKKIDVNSIKTLEQAQQALNKINTYVPAVDGLKKDIEKMGKDFSADKQKVESLKKNIQGSIEGDYKFFQSLLKLPKGGVKGIAISLAQDILAKKLGNIYYYALKALEYSNKLKDDKPVKKEEKKQEPVRSRGRNIYFPTKVYPRFLIQNFAASIGRKNENFYLDAYLRDVSSDPDLWKKPTTFHLGHINYGEELILNGKIDSRTKTKEPLVLEFQANNFPLEIQDSLGFLNIKYFKGRYRFRTAFSLSKDLGTRGTATINFKDIKMEVMNKEEIVSKIIYEAITDAPNVVLEINYLIEPDGKVFIDGKSNIDKLIAGKVGKILDQYAKKYEKQLKDYLSKQINEELKKNETLAKAFNGLEDLSKVNLKDADALKKLLEEKKKEINDKIKSETESKLKEATKNIKLPKF